MQQIFVPLLHAPMIWRGRGEARECQGRRQDMLAKTGVRIFWIERIDQQRVVRLNRQTRAAFSAQFWRQHHF